MFHQLNPIPSRLVQRQFQYLVTLFLLFPRVSELLSLFVYLRPLSFFQLRHFLLRASFSPQLSHYCVLPSGRFRLLSPSWLQSQNFCKWSFVLRCRTPLVLIQFKPVVLRLTAPRGPEHRAWFAHLASQQSFSVGDGLVLYLRSRCSSSFLWSCSSWRHSWSFEFGPEVFLSSPPSS